MSEKIVNLRRARKTRARDEKRARGDANAAVHGLSRAQKALAKARADRATRRLDGHARSDGAEGVRPDGAPPQADDSPGTE